MWSTAPPALLSKLRKAVAERLECCNTNSQLPDDPTSSLTAPPALPPNLRKAVEERLECCNTNAQLLDDTTFFLTAPPALLAKLRTAAVELLECWNTNAQLLDDTTFFLTAPPLFLAKLRKAVVDRKNRCTANSSRALLLDVETTVFVAPLPALLSIKLRKCESGVERQDRCTTIITSRTSPLLLDDAAFFLVCETLNWNPVLICAASAACKQFSTMSKAVLWKSFCLSRAPKMLADLSIDGGWQSLGMLMSYCPGCRETRNFRKRGVAGHFASKTKFSKTSGKSFLSPSCGDDTLYVSDDCEHMDEDREQDVGVFRGIFKAFRSSQTRKTLVDKYALLEQNVYCPFCSARVWSLREVRMLPNSAAKRLGAYDENIECFVCLNGHIHGMCSLVSPDGRAADASVPDASVADVSVADASVAVVQFV